MLVATPLFLVRMASLFQSGQIQIARFALLRMQHPSKVPTIAAKFNAYTKLNSVLSLWVLAFPITFEIKLSK